MTDEQAKNVLLEFCKEKLNLVKLFRWNASMKHGVPIDDSTKLTVPNTSTSTASSVVKEESSFTKFIQAYAVLATLLLVLLGGLAIANYLKKDTVTQPIQNVEANSDLLLPWLEDKGEHLP